MLENDNKKIEEEKNDSSKENIEETLEETTQSEITVEKSETKKISFGRRLKATIIDQIVIGAISFIGMLLFDLILRLTGGLYVSDKLGIYLIIYVIVNLLYPAIIESSKFGNTIGNKLSNIKSVEIK